MINSSLSEALGHVGEPSFQGHPVSPSPFGFVLKLGYKRNTRSEPRLSWESEGSKGAAQQVPEFPFHEHPLRSHLKAKLTACSAPGIAWHSGKLMNDVATFKQFMVKTAVLPTFRTLE